MTAPLCLGIDSQPTRIGLALVTLHDDPEPVWADAFPLVRPGMTTGAAVAAAIRRADAEADRAGADVVRVGIERGIIYGPNTSLETVWDSGGTYALSIYQCQRVWRGTRLLLIPLRVSQWKARALGQGHGNDSKDQVAVWARRWAKTAGWDEVRMNGLATKDATDALGIARGAAIEGGPA